MFLLPTIRNSCGTYTLIVSIYVDYAVYPRYVPIPTYIHLWETHLQDPVIRTIPSGCKNREKENNH